ncbi:MAG: CoA-binding protein [Ignavibacteriales bacterium]|nr:CoA-binding protein [Ignavibacteriales bacterium]
MPIENDDILKNILKTSKTIAVVGASPKPWRDSGNIAQFLMKKGYKVFPVNPAYQEVLGEVCYPDLQSVPEKIDIVDVFRNSDAVDGIVSEAIEVGAKVVWMQLDVVNPEAAQRAEQAGLHVVMDRCIAVDHRRLIR